MTGFAFAETMEGTLTTVPDGATHSFRFELEVLASSLVGHLRDGKAAIRGTVHAPPFAEEAALEGTMIIRPAFARRIAYAFEFIADDGRPLRFVGEKAIRWRRLVETWTTLPGELRDEHGAVVARCATRFDLARDWLPFAKSFHLRRA